MRKRLSPYFASNRQADRLVFKDLFRHAAKHGLIDSDAVERWLRYRDNRNQTAHDYGSGFAEATLKLLPGFIADAIYRSLGRSTRDRVMKSWGDFLQVLVFALVGQFPGLLLSGLVKWWQPPALLNVSGNALAARIGCLTLSYHSVLPPLWGSSLQR